MSATTTPLPSTSQSPTHKTWQGIGYVLLAVILFSIQDVIVKQISGSYPVQEIVCIRSAIALLLLLSAAYYQGGWGRDGLGQLRTKRLGIHTIRGLLMLATYITYYLAIAALPLADAISLYFVSPLFVTLLSVSFLGERATPRHWLAIACGFVGMLVILRPGTTVFRPEALISLISALAYAISVILNRRLSTSESGLNLATYATLAYLLATAAVGVFWSKGIAVESTHPSIQFLARAWTFPTQADFWLMAITGLIAAIGFYALAQAYSIAEATTVAPFEYVMLLMGVIWGYLFWQELPDGFTVIGIILVVSSGLILLPKRGR